MHRKGVCPRDGASVNEPRVRCNSADFVGGRFSGRAVFVCRPSILCARYLDQLRNRC